MHRFFSKVRPVAVLLLAAAASELPSISAGAQETSQGSRPVLERVEIAAADSGGTQIAFVCTPALLGYRLTPPVEPRGYMVLSFPGYRSLLPADLPADEGRPGIRVTEDPEEVRVQITGPNLEIRRVHHDGARLILVLGPERSRNSAERDDGPPAGAVAIDSSYRVGTGDLLTISVFGQDDLGKNVRVLSNGTINFPLVGDIPVAGLTPAEIAVRLTEMLARDYVVNPQVLVGVSEYQSQWVNLIGEVQRPGKYFLKGPTRLIDILAEAGGLSDSAGSELVVTRSEVTSKGEKISRQIRTPTQALFAAQGNDEYNIPVLAGDVVNVLQAPYFYIRGEVGRPGQYPLRPETTLQMAISVAGGLSVWADEKDVHLIRQQGGEQKKLIINLKKVAKGEARDAKIEPDDIIVVGRRIL